MTKKLKKMLIRICIAIVLLLIAKFVPMPGAVRIVLFAVTYLVIGYDILKKAAKGIGWTPRGPEGEDHTFHPNDPFDNTDNTGL